MPKVSKVGKFRKTASLAAKTSADATLMPALAAAADATDATPPTTSIPKDHANKAVVTTSNSDVPKNGNGVPQKSSSGGDSSSSKQRQQQQPLSRGQRKRMAKRDQYLKREQMVLSSLELKRQDDQKKRIDGLDAMKSALLDTIHLHASSSKQGDNEDAIKSNVIIKTNKSRQRLVGKEVAQMSLVLQHPSFQADPFATIRQHLQNTIPQPAATGAAAVDDRKAKREEKRAIKKMSDSVKRKHNKKRARPTRSKAR